MAKHTAGPWHHSAGYQAVLSNDDQIVADVRGIYRPPLTRDTPTGERRTLISETYQVDETEANARLIAEAPAMLEIIRSLASPGINHGASIALLARIDGTEPGPEPEAEPFVSEIDGPVPTATNAKRNAQKKPGRR